MVEPIDTAAILKQVKANRRLVDGCKLHRFEARNIKPFHKATCLACGGEMGLVQIGFYIKGYEAGGGKADDVWPNYRGDQSGVTL